MIVSTFCTGIGSPEFALEQLGIPHQIGFACEIDKYARASYLTRLKPQLILTDMTKYDYIGSEYYADLVVAGLPCQAFSLAGKRLGEADKRGVLFYDFYRYVKSQKPKYFILENVKGLLSMNKGEIFANWLQLLGASVNYKHSMLLHPDCLGYNLHWQVLNTKDYGLPQNRERVFIVGIRQDLPNNFRFPAKQPLQLRLKDLLQPESEVDAKYYLSDRALAACIKNMHGTYSSETQILRWQNKKDGMVTDIIAGTLKTKGTGSGGMRYNSYVITPYNMLEVKEPKILRWQNKKDGIVEDSIIPTLKASGGTDIRKRPYVKHSDSLIRRLTPLEVWRLQGYSDEYFYQAKQVNSDTQLYKQSGNSISTTVIKATLQQLLK